VKKSMGEPMFLLYTPEDKNLNNPFSAFFNSRSKEEFYELSPLNIAPTYDDKPYLNQFDKKLKEHWKLLLRLGIVSVALFLLIFRELFSLKPLSRKISFSFLSTLFTAVAYMWVELILIQKFNILLGSPVISMAIVLITFFFFNGAGSLFSSMISTRGKLFLLMGGTVFLIILYAVLPYMVHALLKQPVYMRMISGISWTAIAGFFAGVPFPLIISVVVDEFKREKVPLLVAFDGIVSVLSAGTLMLLSVLYGFNFMFLLAVVFYFTGICLVGFLLLMNKHG